MKPRHIVISSLCTLFMSMGLLACSSLEANICDKLIEECKTTYGTIKNVDDCTEQFEKDLDKLVSSKREDCENALDDCLDKSSCDNFITCYNDAAAKNCQ